MAGNGNGNGNGNNGNGWRLTPLQAAFVDAYLGSARFNATEAAAQAGYKGNRNTLNSVGNENLAKPGIKAEIDRRLAAHGVTAHEVMSTLADQMRATVADFVDVPEGGRVAILNLDKAKEAGKLHLIKKLYWTQYGPRLELHDAQQAAVTLGKLLLLAQEQDKGAGVEFVIDI